MVDETGVNETSARENRIYFPDETKIDKLLFDLCNKPLIKIRRDWATRRGARRAQGVARNLVVRRGRERRLEPMGGGPGDPQRRSYLARGRRGVRLVGAGLGPGEYRGKCQLWRVLMPTLTL